MILQEVSLSPQNVSTCAGIYLTITMGMTSLSIVLTVFVLQLHHASPRQRPAPAWLHCLMVRYVARALCMRDHVTDYHACARPTTCSAIALQNRRSSKRDVCLVGAFGTDLNGLQASHYRTLFTNAIEQCENCRGLVATPPPHELCSTTAVHVYRLLFSSENCFNL